MCAMWPVKQTDEKETFSWVYTVQQNDRMFQSHVAGNYEKYVSMIEIE